MRGDFSWDFGIFTQNPIFRRSNRILTCYSPQIRRENVNCMANDELEDNDSYKNESAIFG